MPSEKVLELKKQKVADLSAQLKNACAGVVVDYKGINVADDTKLRKELREAGVHYAVVKNTLLHLAVQDAGLQELDNVLSGTTAIALSEDDYVAPARILCKFADASKTFTVKSGFLDGDVIGLEKINSLAKLPSREICSPRCAMRSTHPSLPLHARFRRLSTNPAKPFPHRQRLRQRRNCKVVLQSP